MKGWRFARLFEHHFDVVYNDLKILALAIYKEEE